MRKRGATWDNLPLPAFSLNDVDDSIVEHFKQWAVKKGRIDKTVLIEPKDTLMERLHLKNGSYLTNAAMLLFSKDPEKWQLGAYVKIGFFETDADLLYQDEIHGSILEQIDKIVELVYLKYMKAKITYERMQRIERYFVPEDALREALLNALCHKQYQSGVPIQISVYEDKLYIANCGWANTLPILTTRTSPMYSIWPALLKAGGEALRKSAPPAKRMAFRSPSIQSIPAIL